MSWWVQAIVHLGMAAALALAWRVPSSRLEVSGRGLSLLVLPVLITLVAGMSLVPLPPGVLELVAPGTAAAFPERWHTAAIDPAGVVRTLTVVAGMVAVIVGISASAPRRQRGLRPERWAAVAALVLAAIYAVHAIAQPESMYGILPVAARKGAASAPFVNRNFVGTLALVLGIASIGGLLAGRGRQSVWRGVLWAGSIAAVGLVLGTGSIGVLLVGAVLAIGVAGVRVLGRWGWLVALPVAPLGALVGVSAEWSLGFETTADRRFTQWVRSLPMFPDFPVIGTGLGGYEEGFSPYGPPLEIVRYTYMHNDPYQWMIELGPLAFLLVVAGVVAVLASRCGLAALKPNHRFGVWMALGALAIGLHSLVDFPLQIPALLWLCLALVAGWMTGFTRRREVGPSVVRGLLGVGIGLQILAAVLVGWLGFVEERAARLLDAEPSQSEIATLSMLAPWRAEPVLAEAKAAARAGDRQRAQELALKASNMAPHDAVVLLNAGAVLAVADALEPAAELLARSSERLPADHRAYALASRVAEARGDTEQAIALWAKAVRRWPWTRIEQDRPFERAMQLRPVGLWWLEQLADGPEPYLSANLGYALLRRGEAADALIALEQAAVLDDSYRWVGRRGAALHAIGRTQEALEFLEESDKHDSNGEARMRRAEILLELDLPADARSDAYAALRENSEIPRAALVVLRATARIDGPEEALERAELLIGRKQDASLAEALFVGELADSLGRQPECMRWVDRWTHRPAAKKLWEGCRKRCLTCAAD